MRGGQPTFERIVKNLEAIKGVIDVVIRVNLDQENRPHLRELVRILGARGLLSGERAMRVYAAKLTVYTEQVKMAWQPLSQSDLPGLSDPVHEEMAALGEEDEKAPSVLMSALRAGSCSAMVDHSFVIGPNGHLFKCELGIHDVREAVGSVHEALPAESGERRRLPLLSKDRGSLAHDWGAYNPFDNAKCSGCRFAPACKGGCPKRVLENATDFMQGTCEHWDNNIERLVRELAG
jgi:uncharacterized protein